MMFSNILSCKIRPREFIDRNIFYAGYEKSRSEIKQKNTKDFDQGTVVIQTPSFTTLNIERLRLFSSQQISSAKNGCFCQSINWR